MKEILDQMLRDAGVYYVPEGLPGRAALLQKLGSVTGDVWSDLTPLQRFFLFESAPDLLQRVPADLAREAYCAALEVLPGDWWGPYGRPVSDTSERLKRIGGIDACLLRQLDNEAPLRMGDSEPATLAKLESFAVADLAALLLAARHGSVYAMHRPPEERSVRRQELRRQTEAAG